MNNKRNAKQIISDFRQSKYKINPDGSHDDSVKEAFEDLTNAVEQLATGLYEKDIHFVMELIQNAEDNSYLKGTKPKLEFVLLNDDPTNTEGSDGCLCVFNNEKGFQEDNIKSISAIGKSTKKKVDGFIGEKGIGFKSVYVVSASPHIFSNDYQVKFFENDPSFYLNYIVPSWVDVVPEVVIQTDVETSLLLPLKENKKQLIIDHLADIQPESILFLNKLEGLSIKIEESDKEIIFKRENKKNNICKLQIFSDSLVESRKYWIYKETICVPSAVVEEKRQSITEREITLAFPLDKQSQRGKVFSYLPTETDSGFPFLVNADFMLTANRESIQTERDWNVWLQEALSGVIVNALIKMQKIEKFKKTVYQFIPIPNDEKFNDYFSSISKAVCKKLQELEFILTDRNQIVSSKSSFLVPTVVRDLFDFKQRPNWFDSSYFVDKKLERYSEQLDVIGVSRLGMEEFMYSLGDVEWLEGRKLGWFYQLYQYFYKNKRGDKSSLSDKKIIPLVNSEVVSPNNTVFWLLDESILETLEGILSIDDLPQLNFLNNSLLKKLQQNEGVLLKWINEKLGVTEFSISSYLSESLLPWMDANTTLLDSEKVLLITAFILNQWDCLSDKTKEVISERLPVVLERSKVVRKSELEGQELLVPRGFDPDTGWQNMLQEPEEYDHSDVLDKNYLNLRDNEDSFKEFMKSISAWAYPDLKGISYNSAFGYQDEILSKYLTSIFQSEHSTGGKSLMTWDTPKFLKHPNLKRVPKNRNSLLYWLEGMIESRSSDISNASFKWFYYSSQSRIVKSYLLHCLQTTAWINTTKGLKRPGEVFVDSTTTREIFKNTVPYLQDEISSELCEFLSIKAMPTTRTIIEYLVELSTNKTVDKNLIIKLYEYLDNNGSDYKADFEDNKLMYVPDSKNIWCSINEVIWEDASAAFGDSYGWLSSHYKNLEYFFTSKLEVKKAVDNQAILDTWLGLQSESTNIKEVEAFLSYSIPKIVSMIRDGSGNEALESFFEEAELWIQRRKWIESNSPWGEKVYIPDDQKLRNLFKDEEVYFPWLVPGASHIQQSLFYEKFELPKLSESVDYQVIHSDNYVTSSIKEVLTEHTVQLICEMIVNTDKMDEGLFWNHIESGFIPALSHVDEKKGVNLEVDVSLDSQFGKKLPEVSAFFDKGHAILFISTEADFEDVKDDVAESIAREIWKSGYKSYVDTVRNLLAVTSDKRYKKIRESKGWYFGKGYRDKLNEISDTPFSINKEPESLEEASSSETINDKPKEFTEDMNASFQGEGYSENSGITSQTSNDTNKAFSGINSGAIAGGSSHNKRHRAQRTSHRKYRSRISKARSGTINRQTNTVRRNRMVSYVVNELNKTRDNGNDRERARSRKEQGDITEKIVFDDLSVKGYDVKRMPEGNPGYDLEVTNPESGELYYIEVKSDAFQWSEKGVGISLSQYEFAREKGDSFILAVVDNLANVHSDPMYIINPISHITEYRFDHMWSKVSTNLNTIEKETVEDVAQELMSLTDSKRCKELINYCDEHNYPLPDVGIEISNDDGEVIFEDIELGWEQEKIAVVLDAVDQAILVDSGWEFFIENDEGIESVLEEIFTGAD